MNGSSLDGWCSESARARVSVALVVSSNPCWSGLGEVAIVARALKCKGVSSFQALSGDVFPGGGNDAGNTYRSLGRIGAPAQEVENRLRNLAHHRDALGRIELAGTEDAKGGPAGVVGNGVNLEAATAPASYSDA